MEDKPSKPENPKSENSPKTESRPDVSASVNVEAKANNNPQVTVGMLEGILQAVRGIQAEIDKIKEKQDSPAAQQAKISMDPSSVRSTVKAAMSDSESEFASYPSRTIQRAQRLSRLSVHSMSEDNELDVNNSGKFDSHLKSKPKDKHRRDTQFWEDFDGELGGNRKALREVREIKRSRSMGAGAGIGKGSPGDPGDSEDSDESSSSEDSDIAPSKKQLLKSDKDKIRNNLEKENRALRHRIKEMRSIGEWDNQAPTLIKTHRTMPSTEKVKLDSLDVPGILRFMKRLAEYEARNKIVLDPVQYVEFSVKTQLQAHFCMEGIATDTGWLRQSRTEFFSRLQAYARPRSQEAFIQILNSSVHFKEGFQDARGKWEECLVAAHVYAERFRAYWVFMSRNNEVNTPNVDNKEFGGIKIFLSKIPNSFGISLCKGIIRERYRDIRVFIADFLTLVNEQRNRLVSYKDELLKFGPKDQTSASNKSSEYNKPKKPFVPYAKGNSTRFTKKIDSMREERAADSQSSSQEEEQEDHEFSIPQIRLEQDLEKEKESQEETVSEEEVIAIDPAKKPVEPQRYACYGQAMFGNCDKGKSCHKNHSPGACEQYVLKTLETVCQSPFLKLPEAQALAKKFLLNGSSQFTKPKSFAVLQRTPVSAEATTKKLSTFTHFEDMLASLGGGKAVRTLRPMYVEATVGSGSNTSGAFQCLLDTGASHSNYVRKAFLEKNFPNYERLLKRINSEVRTGSNALVSIEYELTLPITLHHAGETYCADITCCILEDSNTNLIIGLPTLTCEFYELTLARLREAREFYQDTSEHHSTNNVVISSVPYHNKDLCVPVDAFDDPSYRTIAEEELGRFEHTPDSFPGLIDVMIGDEEAKFKEFKEQQETRVNPELPQRERFIQLLDDYFTVFHQSNFDGLCVDPIDIVTREDMPLQHKPEFRFVSVKNEEAFHKEIRRLKDTLYRPSQSPIVHPVVVAPKATEPFIRVCGDYRWINEYIVKPHWPIPMVKEAMHLLAQGEIYGEADITNSFHQLPLTTHASELLTVSIPKHGAYAPTKMPEGVSSASEHLQRIMSEVFDDFIHERWLLVIFDNIVVVAKDVEDLLVKSRKFFERCKEYNLFLKFKKCTWGFPAINFFGYRVSKKGYHLLPEKVDALDAWQFPRNTKKMQSFLGFALFFSPFIPAYSTKAALLYECVHKDFNWKDPSLWKHDYVKIFQDFKETLKTTYLVCFPNYDLEWQLFTDASDLGVAGVLFQVNRLENGENRLEVISFVSHKFSDVALRWSTIEKECFAIFYSLKVLKRMLWGKTFTCYTDHANLQQLAKSDVFKLQRWANFMASFDMKVVHVPGNKNPSDAGSRSFGDILPTSLVAVTAWLTPEDAVIGDEDLNTDDQTHTLATIAVTFQNNGRFDTLCSIKEEDPKEEEERGGAAAVVPTPEPSKPQTPDELFDRIHNAKSGHWGVQRTYALANKLFPGHGLPIRFFQAKIAACVLCQKYRLGHSGALEPLTLHMKVQTRRAAIGADVLKISPPDKAGHIGLLVIVTMSTKLVSLHALKDERSLTLAKEFFVFYSRYGIYDIISVDPGSNISQSVVEELHKLLGVKMKISLVDRHESNGAESTNGQILRHLRMLIQEPRAKDEWGDPTYLACCQYILNSHVNAEASDSLSPFELTFGTEAAPYYQTVGEKILSVSPKERNVFLKTLNEHLTEIWNATKTYQNSILKKRIPPDKPMNCFQAGDFILHLEAKRPTKLDAEYSGPYVVIKQERNNVEAKHITSGIIKFLHVSRVKPFFGTEAEAYEMGTRDNDQFVIEEIQSYRGDPEKRTTLEFLVKFADGDLRQIPWSRDLFESVPYEVFCRKHRHLFPLLFTTETADKEIKKLSKQEIHGYHAGDLILVNLRSYGELWYQALPLPEVDTTVYAVPFKVTSVAKDKRSIEIVSEIYPGKVRVDSYYLFAFTVDPTCPYVEITVETLKKYPALRS